MVRRYQIRLMRSVNARCVSIGLVLALSNCSESGGEPDAMLDIHHPGTGIDSHHQQFHNSYGNMKFIIIKQRNVLRASRRSLALLAFSRFALRGSLRRSFLFKSPFARFPASFAAAHSGARFSPKNTPQVVSLFNRYLNVSATEIYSEANFEEDCESRFSSFVQKCLNR